MTDTWMTSKGDKFCSLPAACHCTAVWITVKELHTQRYPDVTGIYESNDWNYISKQPQMNSRLNFPIGATLMFLIRREQFRLCSQKIAFHHINCWLRPSKGFLWEAKHKIRVTFSMPRAGLGNHWSVILSQRNNQVKVFRYGHLRTFSSAVPTASE